MSPAFSGKFKFKIKQNESSINDLSSKAICSEK
jgi:hypothetical protein